jgi:nucleoside-diphosphate-sugar epimerase
MAVEKLTQRPVEYVSVDIGGTVNMLEFARRNEVEKFVFASSSSVYGKNSKVRSLKTILSKARYRHTRQLKEPGSYIARHTAIYTTFQ